MTGAAGSRGLLALLPRIARYARPHRAPMALGFGLSALGIALDLAKPLPLAIVLDSILGNKPPPALLGPWFAQLAPMAQLGLAAAAIVLIAVCRGMTTMLANHITIDVGQRMVNDLRLAIWTHLQKLSLRFHNKQQTGDLLFRVMADTYAIQGIVMNGALPLISAALMLAGMFVVMVRYDWVLACVALVVSPPLYLAIRWLTVRIHGHATAAKEAESELYSRAETAIGAVKLVQAYGREDRVVQDFRAGSEKSLALSLRLYGDGDPVRAGGGVPAGRGHRRDRVARRAPGDERRPDHRRADRVPLLPARSLPAHPEPEPELRRDQLGPRGPRARLLGGGHRARRQGRARRPDPAADHRRDPVRERELRLRRRPAGASRHRPAHQARRARGHRGAHRGGQEHHGRARAALLRSPARARHHRRPRSAPGPPGVAPASGHPDAAGADHLPGHRVREHRVGLAERGSREGARSGPPHRGRVLHRGAAAGLRHDPGRGRLDAVRRPAPAPGPGAGARARHSDLDPGRADQRAGRGHRGQGLAQPRGAAARADRDRDRAPAEHRPPLPTASW